MRKLFSTLILSTFSLLSLYADEGELIPSLPEQVAAISSCEELLVGDLVSPLSGHVCLRTTDLVAKGAQPISLNRTYISPFMPSSFDSNADWDEYHLYKYMRHAPQGWVVYPHEKIELRGEEPIELRIPMSNGITLDFGLEDSKTFLIDSKCGVSNLGPEGLAVDMIFETLKSNRGIIGKRSSLQQQKAPNVITKRKADMEINVTTAWKKKFCSMEKFCVLNISMEN